MDVSKLDFGKIDARSEIGSGSSANTAFFHDTYLIPSNIEVDRIIRGERWFITGLKGTGKTALLQYLKIEAERRAINTRFILFKREFTEDDRQNFSRAAGYSLVTERLRASDSSIDQDFEDAWGWFFHRYFYTWIIEKNGKDVVNHEDYRRYLGLIGAISRSDEALTSWERWLPSIKGGKLRIGADAKIVKADFEADLEFTASGEIKATLGHVVKICNRYLRSVASLLPRGVIFIDEIELSLGSSDQYARDCKIVRDLIIIISRMNELLTDATIPINIVAGVRSEVLNSVNVLGKEVNKITSDWGVAINWHGRDNDVKHPLFEVFRKKMEACEAREGVEKGDVWDRYFPKKVNDDPFWEYVIRKTWYRPRDFVRFFNLVKDESIRRGQADAFSEQDLVRVSKTYAQESWKEIAEELHTTYSTEQIKGIRHIFTGLNEKFSFEEFRGVKQQMARDAVVRSLEDIAPSKLVEDLYRISVIGNDYIEFRRNGRRDPRQRWAYRGDDDPIMGKAFTLHRGLRGMLGAG